MELNCISGSRVCGLPALISAVPKPGISYSALPMYLGELAPKNLRGLLGTMTEVFVIIGVFLAQIFSLQVILGNPEGNRQPQRSR